MAILRKSKKSDLAIVSSWIEDKEACRLWGGDYMRFPHTVAQLAEDIKFATERTYTLVDKDDRVIGLGQLLRRNLRLHLARIIVAPSVRGKGFGRMLCEKLIAEGVDRFGTDQFSLNVYKFNTPALHLYQNLGFTAAIPPGDSFAGIDCVYMHLQIGNQETRASAH